MAIAGSAAAFTGDQVNGSGFLTTAPDGSTDATATSGTSVIQWTSVGAPAGQLKETLPPSQPPAAAVVVSVTLVPISSCTAAVTITHQPNPPLFQPLSYQFNQSNSLVDTFPFAGSSVSGG